MILYLAPGACSLADHIALHEAGLKFDHVKVDLKTKTTADGRDYLKINPKGYVPALTLESGETLTENIAILNWIAAQKPSAVSADALAPSRLLEMLAFISTEVHKSFKPFFNPDASDKEKAAAKQIIAKRLGFLADRLHGGYLLGNDATVADFYLFVMLTWAQKNGVDVPTALTAYFEKLKTRPSVRRALEHEGLDG
jgi:glutathione S-transferase